MLPMQFLVVRNVTISTKDWGSDGETMSQLFGETGGAWDKSSSNANAAASYGFGPLTIKGNVSHDQAKEGVSRYGKNTSAERQKHEGHFDGTTLTIPGAQIVAWLSTIVPACAPLDYPGLAAQPAPAAADAAKTSTPAAAVPAH
jgi:hypothetical protein